MANPVYSSRFLAFDLGVGGTVSYTVPTGWVAVLRDLDAASGSPGSTTLYMQCPGTVALPVIMNFGAAFVTQQWQGRQVLNAGETLTIGAVGGTFSGMLSGYLLAA